MIENTVVDKMSTQNFCVAVLKTGIRKGEQCSATAKYIVNDEYRCGRHNKGTTDVNNRSLNNHIVRESVPCGTDYINLYQAISFNDPQFKDRVVKMLIEDGVVVIDDVLTMDQSDQSMTEIIDTFQKLETGIIADEPSSWLKERLPPQTRSGLFQCLMSNITPVWGLRSNSNVRTVFETIYSALRNKEVKDFICSGDGINIRPKQPSYRKDNKDWAHLDQTEGDIFKCVQGQVVLTNTTASFRCSPKSHLIFDKLKNSDNFKISSNWHKFPENQYDTLKSMLDSIGGQWQIPIIAKKGSMILWFSSLIHSARTQIGNLPIDGNDKYRDWRGVVYICYRPKEEFTEKEIKKRSTAVAENRVTNHWSIKIFQKRVGSHFLYTNMDEKIKMLVDHPETLYDLIGEPVLNDEQKRLAGIL